MATYFTDVVGMSGMSGVQTKVVDADPDVDREVVYFSEASGGSPVLGFTQAEVDGAANTEGFVVPANTVFRFVLPADEELWLGEQGAIFGQVRLLVTKPN